jgi:hypothetical protein
VSYSGKANLNSTQPGQPKVIAIVLNWNLPDDTRRCVESLKASDYSNLEILVIDNGSQLAAFEQLQAGLPGERIIRSESNLGFAGGNNLGLQFALEQKADFAFVINNDTLVDPQMISTLIAAAEANPAAGLLGPIIYYLSRPDEVWFAGYRFLHGIYVLRRGLHLKTPLRPIEEVDFVSGCGLLIRRHILEDLGLFSQDYFMYYEDLDFCFRVKEAGLKILCVTSAKMWHAVSASSGGADSPQKQYYQVKSSLIFYQQHSRGVKRVLNIALRLGHAGFTLIGAVLRGRLKLAAIVMFVRGLRDGLRPA